MFNKELQTNIFSLFLFLSNVFAICSKFKFLFDIIFPSYKKKTEFGLTPAWDENC